MDPMVAALAEREAANAQVHPPTPGLQRSPMTGTPMQGGAVPTKPAEDGFLMKLLALLQSRMQGGAPVAPMPGENPASGLVDTINQNVMSPIKKGMDYLSTIGSGR